MSQLYQKIIPKSLKPEKKVETVSNLIEQLEAQDQINLDIKVKKVNQIHKIRKTTRSWFQIMKINPYWKNISAIAMIITSLADSLIFLYVYLTNYKQLPEILPSVFNQTTQLWNYANKDEMFVIPIIHLVISLIIVRLNITIFKFDRRLVLIINNSMILFNMIFLYEILQIYTMLMVY
jgi:hypothetical protein